MIGAFNLCAVMSMAGAVYADPPDTAQRLREIAALEDAARSSQLAPAQRRSLLDEVIAARAALIEAAPNDDRATTWLLDQVSDILLRAARDGADASVVYGLPTPQQVRRIRDAAADASRLLRRADEQAVRIVARLEASIFAVNKGDPAAVRAAAQEAEGTLGILVDTEQAWRIGLLRARIAVLVAATEDVAGSPASSTKLLAGAISSLSTTAIPRSLPDAELSRRLTLGAAKLIMGRLRDDPPDRTMDPRVDFRWVVQSLDDSRERAAPLKADRPAAAYFRTRAASGIALCSRTAQEAQDTCDLLIDTPELDQQRRGPANAPASDLLAGEVTARVFLLTRWTPRAGPDRTTVDRNAAWIDKALAGLVASLDHAPSVESQEIWRQLVYTKIASVLDPSMPLERVTPHAAFARAVQLAGQDPQPGEEAAARLRRHTEAARLFRMIESRVDAGSLRAEALWEAASLTIPTDEQAAATMNIGQRIETATMLLRLTTEYPDSARCRAALETAVWLTRFPAPPGAAADQVLTVRELHLASREKAVRLSPPLPDDRVCRLELGRMLAERARTGSAESAASDARRAVDLLTQAASDPTLAPLADRDIGDLFNRVFDPSASAQLADADRAELALAAVAWAERRAPDQIACYELTLAEAWQATGEPKANPLFAKLVAKLDPVVFDTLSRGEQAMLRAAAARIRLGTGRAARASGDTKRAFETLRTLADELDHEPDVSSKHAAAPLRSREFWAAWTELVEMLAADNPHGDRTSTIRLQLNRLMLIDSGFGPEPYATRLKKIKASLN